MTTEENKALFLRYQDALRRPELLDDLLTEDFVAYDLPAGQRDREGLKQFRARVNAIAPDQTVRVDYLLAEGDLVAAHLTGNQTLPDGERAEASLIEIVEVTDGRIAWRRGGFDERLHALRERMRAQQGNGRYAMATMQTPQFTLMGTTFALLEGPERRADGAAVVQMTMPPDTGRFLAPDHRHPTEEEVEVVSGRAGITHGYGEERTAAEPGPGERVHLGANEWHGIRNLSAEENLVLRLVHMPGEKWALVVREGARLEQAGGIPPEFMQQLMQETRTEFARSGER